VDPKIIIIYHESQLIQQKFEGSIYQL